MPNWCATTITLNCNNKKNAKFIYKNIEKWISSTKVDNSWGFNWLGNILINSGLYDSEDTNFPRCRGCITYLDKYEEQVVIDTETAWVPMLRMWTEVCDKVFTGMVNEIMYTAEEPGCNLYWTNDPALLDQWIFDSSGETEYDLSEKELRERLLEFLPKEVRKWHDCDDIYALAELCEKMQTDEGDYLWVHKYEFVPLAEIGD